MGGNSDGEQKKLSKSILGINISKRKALPVTKSELKSSDLIIIVANDIPKIMLNYKSNSLLKKVVIWKIKDEHYNNKRNIKQIILKIKKKVDELNRTLNKK